MSHFSTIVLLPADTKPEEYEDKITALLAPYDENTNGPEREERCWCVGLEALKDTREKMDTLFPLFEILRSSFRDLQTTKKLDAALAKLDDVSEADYAAMPRALKQEFQQERKALTKQIDAAWQVFANVAGREAARAKLIDEHPGKDVAHADCEDCHGTGKRMTTYNEKSKWDWWVIGGRWPDFFNYGDYDPMTDPDNYEPCRICEGTGKRTDPLGNAERARNPGYTCNGCSGKGKSLKFSLKVTDPMAPVSTVLARWAEEPKVPFAIVTPDGAWHEQGGMGWFGVVRDERDENEWAEQVKAMLTANPDCIAVACDLHI